MSDYIKEMDAELGKYPELPQDTGNEGVNAMLMKAVPECSEKGIEFRYVVLGHIDDMDSMDMGNLLNNLLSNAVEAAEKKEGNKEVELIIRREGEAIEIELANSTSGSVLEKNRGLQSQKLEQSNKDLNSCVEDCKANGIPCLYHCFWII